MGCFFFFVGRFLRQKCVPISGAKVMYTVQSTKLIIFFGGKNNCCLVCDACL